MAYFVAYMRNEITLRVGKIRKNNLNYFEKCVKLSQRVVLRRNVMMKKLKPILAITILVFLSFLFPIVFIYIRRLLVKILSLPFFYAILELDASDPFLAVNNYIDFVIKINSFLFPLCLSFLLFRISKTNDDSKMKESLICLKEILTTNYNQIINISQKTNYEITPPNNFSEIIPILYQFNSKQQDEIYKYYNLVRAIYDHRKDESTAKPFLEEFINNYSNIDFSKKQCLVDIERQIKILEKRI